MTIHIGLIGGGTITETRARAAGAVSGVDIAAVYGTNAERIDRVCREHGGRPYRHFEAFLTHRPLDSVIIGSPSGLHAIHGIAATLHGLHVLTEKPGDERGDHRSPESLAERIRGTADRLDSS